MVTVKFLGIKTRIIFRYNIRYFLHTSWYSRNIFSPDEYDNIALYEHISQYYKNIIGISLGIEIANI